MKRCIIIDDFLEDPHSERKRALAATYENVKHRGLDYPGISIHSDEKMEDRIRDALDVASRGRFESFFRRYLPEDPQATFIHNDCQIGIVSGILFLTRPEDCRGGLAFWKHRLYGWETQPGPGVIERFGETDSPEFWDKVKNDGFEERRWEMVDYAPMEFNRLVLFSSARYHSRYPKEFIGASPHDCRLIKVFFWTPDEPKKLEAGGAEKCPHGEEDQC